MQIKFALILSVPLLFIGCSTNFKPIEVVEIPEQQPVVIYEEKIRVIKEFNHLEEFVSSIVVVLNPSNVNDAKDIANNIIRISKEESVDPIFVAAVITSESRFKRTAKSRVGARGLMQIMPGTGKYLTKKHNVEYKQEKLFHPEFNIKLGVKYLKELEDRYNGNRYLALAAYNWGPGKVDRNLNRPNRFPKSVRNYSNSIIERTLYWNQYLLKANQ